MTQIASTVAAVAGLGRPPQQRRTAVLVALVVIVVLLFSHSRIDRAAQAAAADGLKRALVTFATARALNGAVSLLQSVQLSGQVIFAGVAVEPGQLLDGLNRLVEEFSAVMLAVSAAFAIELMLLKMGAHWVVSALTLALALAWATWTWRAYAGRQWITRLLVGMLLVRLALPLAMVGSNAAFEGFLASEYANAQAAAQAEAKLSEPAGDDKTWKLPGVEEVTKRFGQLKDRVDNTTRHIVDLVMIFVLQTIVIPLLVVWLLMRCGRMLLQVDLNRGAIVPGQLTMHG